MRTRARTRHADTRPHAVAHAPADAQGHPHAVAHTHRAAPGGLMFPSLPHCPFTPIIYLPRLLLTIKL
eukprot:5098566-Pleurochrysis_carterae.AAC.2